MLSSLADITAYLNSIYSNTKGIELYTHAIANSIDYLNTINTSVLNVEKYLNSLLTNSNNYQNLLKDINISISRVYLSVLDIQKYVVKINQWLADIYTPVNDINQSLYSFLLSFQDFVKAFGEYFQINFTIDNGELDFTHTIKQTFKELLMEVFDEVNKKVNPLHKDNKVEFDNAINLVKTQTFMGSVYKIVDDEIPKISTALSGRGSAILQLQTAGVSTTYFNLPAHTLNLDFSWYSPFKAYGDMIISGFIWLFYLWKIFCRLPSIIAGESMSAMDNFQANIEDQSAYANEQANQSALFNINQDLGTTDTYKYDKNGKEVEHLTTSRHKYQGVTSTETINHTNGTSTFKREK